MRSARSAVVPGVRAVRRGSALALVCGLSVACGAGNTSASDRAITPEDAAQPDLPFAVVDEVSPDPADPRADVYVAGMRKTGANGLVRVVLVAADPAPPFRGQSTWTLYVSDPNGFGIPDATVTLTPYVPDHGHGAAVKPTITAGDLPGLYVATPVNLTMQVLWVTTVAVTLPDGRSDSVEFGFLIGA